MTAIQFIEYAIQVAAKFGSNNKQKMSQLNSMFEKFDDLDSSKIIMKLFVIDDYDVQNIAGKLFSINAKKIKFDIEPYLENGIEVYNKSIYDLPECLVKKYSKDYVLNELKNAKSENKDAQEKIDTLIWWIEKKTQSMDPSNQGFSEYLDSEK